MSGGVALVVGLLAAAAALFALSVVRLVRRRRPRRAAIHSVYPLRGGRGVLPQRGGGRR